MRHTKKGDLAISTNAIVILIIAVIMLGLIITFVTGVFNRFSGNFTDKLNEIPVPARPTSSNPITYSLPVIGPTTTKIAVKPGETLLMKFQVFNPNSEPATGAYPSIDCGTDTPFDMPGEKVNKKTIPARGAVQFDYILPVSKDAESDLKLCELVAKGVTDPDTSEDLRRDVAVEVRG